MISEEKNAICYYRVSTKKQEISGLGLESQEHIARDFCKKEGYKIIKEFTEVESGGKVDRKILNEALEEVKKINGVLLVTNLDRLTRNLTHLISIRESGIKFIVIDQPDSNECTLNIYCVMAERERKMTSIAIKDALAAKKARGEHIGRKVGSTRKNQVEINENLSKKGTERYLKSIECLRELFMKNRGMKITEITKKVEESGYRTMRGSIATCVTVRKYISDLYINWKIEDKVKEEIDYTCDDMVKLLHQKFRDDDLKKIVVDLKL